MYYICQFKITLKLIIFILDSPSSFAESITIENNNTSDLSNYDLSNKENEQPSSLSLGKYFKKQYKLLLVNSLNLQLIFIRI